MHHREASRKEIGFAITGRCFNLLFPDKCGIVLFGVGVILLLGTCYQVLIRKSEHFQLLLIKIDGSNAKIECQIKWKYCVHTRHIAAHKQIEANVTFGYTHWTSLSWFVSKNKKRSLFETLSRLLVCLRA